MLIGTLYSIHTITSNMDNGKPIPCLACGIIILVIIWLVKMANIPEEDYKKITSPTRMQYARYRNGLSDVFTNSYGKAKAYLQRVLQVFPSMEAGNTLEKIKKMELELK